MKRTKAANQSFERSLSRSSSPTSSGAHETPGQKATSFLLSLGHSPPVARGIIDALEQSGLSGESLLSMVRSLAGRYEVGEDAGLEALAASVKDQLERQSGKQDLVTLWCLPSAAWSPVPDAAPDAAPDAEVNSEALPKVEASMERAFPVKALSGTTLTDVAKFGTLDGSSTLREYLECSCSGIMACSTCHVVIHPDWFARVGSPSEAEQDMIDLAYEPQCTSRLGCQIVLTKQLDGLVILLPRGANNLMDFVPFEG